MYNAWCVYYQSYCDSLEADQLRVCSECGLSCHTCPQRLGGVPCDNPS